MDKDVESGLAFPPAGEPDDKPNEEMSSSDEISAFPFAAEDLQDKPEEKGSAETSVKPEDKPEEKGSAETPAKPEDKPEDKQESLAEIPAKERPNDLRPTASSSGRRVVKWKRTNFIDSNFGYLMGARGILNLVHMALSVAIVVLLGLACQLRPSKDQPSEGFFCKPPEVFLFITACISIFNSLLFTVCCLLSKRTDNMLFQTAIEIVYYIVFIILYLTASIVLLMSIINWGPDRMFFNSDYATLQSIAIVGLAAAACYGISTLWFFISHKVYVREIILEDGQVVDDQIVREKRSKENSKK